MIFNAKVTVRLKKGLLDPQGTAINGALKSLGFVGVKEVKVGKFIEIFIDAKNEAEARKQAEAMGKKLLANPVIEVFGIEIEAKSSEASA